MSKELKVGAYLLKDLNTKKVLKKDVVSLIEYVIANPLYTGNNNNYKGFKLNKALNKYLTDLLETYVILNPKYEPLRDTIILNHDYEKQTLEAFKILTETRNKVEDEKTIAVISSGFQLVKEKLNIKDADILREGNIIENLKVAFRKRLGN